MTIAQEIATRVNDRIIERARKDADETGEIQGPPQVSPQHVTHHCANCTGTGKPSTAIQLRAAIAVCPSSMREAIQQISTTSADGDEPTQ